MNTEERVWWVLPRLGWGVYVPRAALTVAYGVAWLALVSGFLVDSPGRKLAGIGLAGLLAAGERHGDDETTPPLLPGAPPRPLSKGEWAIMGGIGLVALIWVITDFAGVVLLAVAAAAGWALAYNVGNVRAQLPLFQSADPARVRLGWIAAWLVGLATVTCLTPRPGQPAGPTEARRPDGHVVGSVLRALDGDTLEVRAEGRQFRVRVLGVDATELRRADCFARQAAARTQALTAGQAVWLEYDPQQRGLDHHGRDRAHVWLADGTLLGWLLIREGYARVPDYRAPHRYEAEYRRAQDLARAEGRGGWRSCGW